MTSIKNILIIKLSWIGDILFTLPSFYLLKEHYPESNITILTSPQNAPIFKGFPGINQILILDRRIFKNKKLKPIFQHSTELFHKLKQGDFDLAIDFQGAGETAFLAWLTGAKHRLGIIKNGCSSRANLYTHKLQLSDQSHRIDQSLNLLTTFGVPSRPVVNEFNLPDEYLKKAQNFLLNYGYSLDKPIIYLQPFSGKTYKNWPLENFYALAQFWRERDVQVIFGGGPADVDLLKPVCSEFLTTAGKTDLLTSAGLMKLASLVIGNDTGPLHLAVALQKRVIMLMGPSETVEFGPYQHPEWVIRDAQTNNINDISLDEVIDASLKTFDEIRHHESHLV